jgi:glyoxylate/hydroxypyruvate reductase A
MKVADAVLVSIGDSDRASDWHARLARLLPERLVLRDGAAFPAEDIGFAVVWKQSAELFGLLPNLRGILSIGAGIDAILADHNVPQHVEIVRMVDPALTLGMREYVLLHVLRCHRRQGELNALQRARDWSPLVTPIASERRVGVMGLGMIGADVARHLAVVGFDVAGWKRTPATVDLIKVFAGEDSLPSFLARTQILVSLLPATPATRGMLGRRLFNLLPRGAFVINAGRGECLVEKDLLASLDEGQIAGATLDVFQTEPLPSDHPFWDHPRVTVTPHIASLTSPESGARHITAAIRAICAGERPAGYADRDNGY